jgi:hypothetical protein
MYATLRPSASHPESTQPPRRQTSLTSDTLMAFLTSLMTLFPLISSSPLVTLSSGTFRGLTVNGDDRWLGIPYAQPPLGPLRFEAPVSISRPVGSVHDALNFSHACPQPPTTAPISEDCLYLNVCL